MPTIEAPLSEACCNWDHPRILSRTGQGFQPRNRLDRALYILHRVMEG